MRTSRVTCIIATTCTTKRRETIFRALESLYTQQEESVIPLIVVNGAQVDPSLRRALSAERRIIVEQRQDPGYSAALHHGRGLVSTEFFSFLDDDDVYLENAISDRVRRLEGDASLDAIVSNGYEVNAGQKCLVWTSSREMARSPLQTLLTRNWLLPCSGMYRTDRIPAQFFDPTLKSMEWTHLAVLLTLKRRFCFSDTPTFLYHGDTPDSLSKQEHFAVNALDTLSKILKLELDGDAYRQVWRKRSATLHDLATRCIVNRSFRTAWRYHLQSLVGWRDFFRYAAFSRHLLRASLGFGNKELHSGANGQDQDTT